MRGTASLRIHIKLVAFSPQSIPEYSVKISGKLVKPLTGLQGTLKYSQIQKIEFYRYRNRRRQGSGPGSLQNVKFVGNYTEINIYLYLL